MDWEPIHKQPADFADANLKNHDSYIADFSWERACALLDGMPGGALNIAYQAIHRQLSPARLGHDNELAISAARARPCQRPIRRDVQLAKPTAVFVASADLSRLSER